MHKLYQKRMRSVRSIRWAALIVLLSTGCYARPSTQEQTGAGNPPVPEQPVAATIAPKEKAVEEAEMKVGDLHPTLLRTVDAYPEAFTSFSKGAINESPAVVLEDGRIKIGRWRCDLKKKTFIYGDEAVPGMASYRVKKGIFVRNARGEWVGEITDLVSAHK